MAVLLSLHQSSELKPRPNYPHLNGRPHPPSTAPRLAAKLLGLSMILLTLLVPVADSSLSNIAIITTSIPTMETKMYKFSWQRATFYANGALLRILGKHWNMRRTIRLPILRHQPRRPH